MNEKAKLRIKDAQMKIRDLQLNIATPPTENDPKYHRVWPVIVKTAEQKIKELQQLSQEVKWNKTDDSDSQVTMASVGNEDGEGYNTDNINQDKDCYPGLTSRTHIHD